MFAAHLGVDAALGAGVRAGAVALWFEGSVDYTDESGETPVVRHRHGHVVGQVI